MNIFDWGQCVDCRLRWFWKFKSVLPLTRLSIVPRVTTKAFCSRVYSGDEMNLALFTPEILSQILNDIPSTWLVNLWLTGSRPLRHALSSRGGVTSIILQRTKSLCSPSRLPGMVSSLTHLTSLTISSPDRVAHTWRLWKCLASLRFLDHLTMNFPKADECLLYPLQNKVILPKLLGDPPQESDASESMLATLSNTFPCLRALKMQSIALLIDDNLLSLLPKSLTLLEVSSETKLTAECFKHLSSLPNIESLHLNIVMPALRSLEGFFLPPTITHLHLSCNSPYFLHIPSSFWNGCNLVKLDVPMTADSCQHVPGLAIEEIVFDPALPLTIPHMPALKAFDVKACRISDFTKSILPFLPQTLERLSIETPASSPNSDNVKSNIFLPANLTTLTILWHNCSMKELETVMDAVGALKRLEVFNLLTHSFWTTSRHLRSLPSSLKSFYWRNPLSALELEENQVASLPRGLTTLRLKGRVALRVEALRRLPPALNRLSTRISFSGNPKSFNGLPKVLRDVNLRFGEHAHSSVFSIPIRIAKECAALPLRALAIRSERELEISLEILKTLPRDLQHLRLSGVSMVHGSFDLLPKSLRSLDLVLEDSHTIKGSEIKFLPRNLATLSLSGLQFTQHHMSTLPPSLTHLTLTGDRIEALDDVTSIQHIPKHSSFACSINTLLERKAGDVEYDYKESPFQDPDPRTVRKH